MTTVYFASFPMALLAFGVQLCRRTLELEVFLLHVIHCNRMISLWKCCNAEKIYADRHTTLLSWKFGRSKFWRMIRFNFGFQRQLQVSKKTLVKGKLDDSSNFQILSRQNYPLYGTRVRFDKSKCNKFFNKNVSKWYYWYVHVTLQ